MDEAEVTVAITERLARRGVCSVQAVNSPTIRSHSHRWALTLADSGDARRAVRVLRHMDGIEDVRRDLTTTGQIITFEYAPT